MAATERLNGDLLTGNSLLYFKVCRRSSVALPFPQKLSMFYRKWLEMSVGCNLCVDELVEVQRVWQRRLHLLIAVPVHAIEVDARIILHLIYAGVNLRQTFHA